MFGRWVLLLLTVFLSCGYAVAEVKVNNYPPDPGSVIFFNGGPDGIYLAYYAKTDDHTIYVKRVDKDLAKETALPTDMRGTFLDISFLKDGMALTWRPKKSDGKKYIYVQRSDDNGNTFKEPLTINSTTDALVPITTVSDGQERLYVVWLDERKGKHRLYMNYSEDGGKSFLKEDVVLTPDIAAVNLPALLLKDKRVDLFFIGTGKEPKQEIYEKGEAEAMQAMYHKYSEDGGRTWSETGVVQAGTASVTPLVPVRIGNKLILFWARQEGLFGAVSTDGKTWEKMDFKETAGKEVNRIAIANAGDRVYIAASWMTRLSKDEKPNVYFLKSEDGGATWSAPLKLNTNEFNSTSSVFPAIAAGSDGKTVVVAWQDHRDIRGSIRINYSRDGGATWLKGDVPLEKEPGKYNDIYPQAISYGNKFYVLWYRTDDRKVDADLYLQDVEIK